MSNGQGEDRQAAAALDKILMQALKQGASDIHLEPGRRRLRVRFRIDGVMVERPALPVAVAKSIVIRLKVMSKLDITVQRLPQDGGFRMERGGLGAHFRLSTFPTDGGEKIVLRVMSDGRGVLGLDELGMQSDTAQELRTVLAQPNGIVLVTGPTGSGKTSTLYALLTELRNERVNIITLEDPVEYRMPGITQGQAWPQVGFDFATGLRAILRQDPDIMMVGEMRDTETASIAFRAALTGHLVLSTLHTNSVVESIVRLIDMGIEAYVVGSALRAVVSQRLVRRLCRACREGVSFDPKGLPLLPFPTGTPIYQARGCKQCSQTGYRGRTGLFEVVSIDETLGDLIKSEQGSRGAFRETLRARGVVSVRDQGFELVRLGQTSIDEVMRVT